MVNTKLILVLITKFHFVKDFKFHTQPGNLVSYCSPTAAHRRLEVTIKAGGLCPSCKKSKEANVVAERLSALRFKEEE